jgi:hypothetical protein
MQVFFFCSARKGSGALIFAFAGAVKDTRRSVFPSSTGVAACLAKDIAYKFGSDSLPSLLFIFYGITDFDIELVKLLPRKIVFFFAALHHIQRVYVT